MAMRPLLSPDTYQMHPKSASKDPLSCLYALPRQVFKREINMEYVKATGPACDGQVKSGARAWAG